MPVKYHAELAQGTDEWFAARCGLLTASELKLAVTPTLKVANNEKTRAHVYELMAQRITGHVETRFISHDMERGWNDEAEARYLYSEKVAKVDEVGFITNDEWGFTLGYSPDGLVGDDGLIEIKSRRQKFQVQTIAENAMPGDYMIQIQAGMLISGRKWCDFISYSGGLPIMIKRIYPDKAVQDAIIAAATQFEATIAEKMSEYETTIAAMKESGLYFETERREEDILV